MKNKFTEKTLTSLVALAGICLVMIPAANAQSVEEACEQPRFKTWKKMQSERLWSPSEATLEQESAGKVFKYYCFSRSEIDRFYETQPDRIENAHFHPVIEDDPGVTIVASASDEYDCD